MFNIAVAIPLLAIALSWLLATMVCRRRFALAGFGPQVLGDLSFWAALGALAGARAFYVVIHWPLFLAYPQDVLLTLPYGLSFYGGLAGGLVGFVWQARRARLPVPALAACAAPALPLGIGLARLALFAHRLTVVGPVNLSDAVSLGLVADFAVALSCLLIFLLLSAQRSVLRMDAWAAKVSAGRDKDYSRKTSSGSGTRRSSSS